MGCFCCAVYPFDEEEEDEEKRNWKQWIQHSNLENDERIVGKWISDSCALFCFHATFRLKRVLQIGGV